MDNYFEYKLQDVRYERTLILMLALSDPQILLNAKFSQIDIDKLIVLAKEEEISKKRR